MLREAKIYEAGRWKDCLRFHCQGPRGEQKPGPDYSDGKKREDMDHRMYNIIWYIIYDE